MLTDAAELEATSARIAPFIHRTPVLTSRALDERSGARLFFKCENFQKVGAFKMRGAANAVAKLSDDRKRRGVATHSSGNFAQALARAARELGLTARIVMPSNTPQSKKEATRGYGAEITECEPTLRARQEALDDIVRRTGATFVHPSDDPDVIAGQGTACMELIQDTGPLDWVVAPVGGGGLISGTALAVHHFAPGTKVAGGEPSRADDAYRSLQAGVIVPSVNPRTIADGLLTSLGPNTFAVIRALVSHIVRVEEEEIVSAMRYVWERMKIVIEPSAAVAVAAVVKDRERFGGCRVGVILSGGNVDLNRLPF